MAKINFRQPKFILPIIILPFLLLGYFVYSSFKSKANKGKMTLADSLSLLQQKGFNAEMPSVSKEVKDGAVKDKFAAYREAYKNEKDYSAINSLGSITTPDNNRMQSAYSETDLQKLESNRRLDSIRQVLEGRKVEIQQRMATLTPPGNSTSKNRPRREDLSDNQVDLLNRLRMQGNNEGYPAEVYNSGRTTQPANERAANNSKPLGGSYEEQMKLFKDQMKMVDSMQRSNGPQKAGSAPSEAIESNRQLNPSKDTSFKPMHVSLAGEYRSSGSFNTIKQFNASENIRAIIDEAKVVRAGGRIRIKLLQNIYVGDELLPSGTLLYGFVTGFQTQRVNISVSNVNYNGKPLPVKLDVYDNDGYIGLYVPGSNFREFTKDIGTQSTQGLSPMQQASSSSVEAGIISKLFSTGTNTVGKIISQNKVGLKADYIIFLKENKTTSK